MLKRRIKTIEKYIAVIAFPMFIAMILACTSSQEAVSGATNYETNDADADGAMITDTIASPFNDYALNK